MQKIALIVDSACDLSLETLKEKIFIYFHLELLTLIKNIEIR